MTHAGLLHDLRICLLLSCIMMMGVAVAVVAIL
jgi:hypothetical protein